MKTKMTVNGVSVCPTGEERHEYFTRMGFDDFDGEELFLPAEGNGSANTTTGIRTASCSPASPRHWRSAEQNGIHG